MFMRRADSETEGQFPAHSENKLVDGYPAMSPPAPLRPATTPVASPRTVGKVHACQHTRGKCLLSPFVYSSLFFVYSILLLSILFYLYTLSGWSARRQLPES